VTDARRTTLLHLACVAVYVAVACGVFLPAFSGRTLPQPDLLQYRGMAREALEIADETGEVPLWTNSMFGGMPTYLIHTPSDGNLVAGLDPVLRLGIPEPAGRFVAAMLAFHVLLWLLGAGPGACLVGSLAFGLATEHLVLVQAGHATKLRAIAAFPWVAAGVVLAFRRPLAGGLLFAAGLSLELAANHVQMTYYLFLTLPILLGARLLHDARAGRARALLLPLAALALGAVLGVASNAARIWSTWEYARHTVRGERVLPEEADAGAGRRSGFSFQQAMAWSHAPRDLAALLVPGAVGGSSAEPAGPATARQLAARGRDPRAAPRAPLYWGGLPFTSGPPYLGAVTLLLAGIGLLRMRGPVRVWVVGGVALTLALSLGRHLSAPNQLVFDWLPFYDRFRAPNSIALVTGFLLCIPAGLALDRLRRPDGGGRPAGRALLGVGLGLALVVVAFVALGLSRLELSHAMDARLARAGLDPAALVSDRRALLLRDGVRTVLWLGGAAGLLALHVRGGLRPSLLVPGLAAMVVLDQGGVGLRYLGWERWVDARALEAASAPGRADREILADPEPGFRVLDRRVDPWRSALPALHHRLVGGYHAAKLRRAEDVIDRYLRGGRTPQPVLDMLDVRYLIEPTERGGARVRRNPGALGRAWLVDEVLWVDDARAELEALGAIEPGDTAVVHREFAPALAELEPGAGGRVEVLSQRPDRLRYRVDADGPALLVLSEVWYGPDAGWRAWIDDTPAPIVRADYLLRAVRVPAGRHLVRLEFAPRSFLLGRWIARVASAAILLAGVTWAVLALRRRRRPPSSPPAPGIPAAPASGTRPDGG